MVEAPVKETREAAVADFDELMQEVAQLPTEQQEKVAYFTQGVIAAANSRREAAANE